MHDSFIQLASILVLVMVAGVLAKLLRQPVIVAYIAVGVLAGPAFFGLVSQLEEVTLLAEIGIAILLFLVGMKLDLNLIRSTGMVALVVGLIQVAVTAAVGYVISLAFGLDLILSMYVAVALAFSSTIIIIKLLTDLREIDQLHGRIAVGVLIVQDIIVIIAMVAIVAVGQPGEVQTTEQILFMFLGAVGFLALVAALAKYVLPKALEWLAKSQELILLFGVSWAISLAALSSALGLRMEIGAFVAGVALAATPYRESLGARMVSLKDIMILFFFIELGSMLDFSNAVSQIWPALALSAFVLIGKPLIVMLVMGWMGYRSRVSLKTGLALAQISEFSLILIALGYSFGQVNEEILSLVTLVAVITITVSTYFMLYSEKILDRFGSALTIFERRSSTQSLIESAQEHPYDAIVVGSGRLGSAVIAGLLQRKARLLVVDYDPQALRHAREQGVDTLFGDVGEPEFAATLPIHETSSVVCAVPENSVNFSLLQTLRRFDFQGSICLTAMDDRSAALISEANPEVEIIRPLKMAAASIVEGMNIRIQAEQSGPDGGAKD